MASTFFGLNIGNTGLHAYKAALDVTAHNIANIERPGYSRQVLGYNAARPLSTNSSYGMMGTGIDSSGISQMRDTYFDMKFWKNQTLHGEYATKENYMNQIQSYFNELQLEGFTTSFDSMHESLQELTKNPSSLTSRTQVTNYATSLTEYFNFLSESLTSIQEENNFEIKNQVDKINSIAQELATLNKQINTIEIGNNVANDLRDERALLIDKLSTIVDVSVQEIQVGQGVGVNNYIVKINGQLLVDADEFNTLKVVPREERVNQNDIKGLYDVTWQDGQNINPIGSAKTGALKALFQLRDGNDGGNLQGLVTAKKGDTEIVLTDTNINNVEKMNVPETGVIRVGNREYTYDGFVAKKTDGKIEYTFNLKDGKKVLVDENDKPTEIGKSIKYKGIPYYMGQLNEFIRTYSKNFNDIHKEGVDLEGRQATELFNGTDLINGENFVFGDDNAVIRTGSQSNGSLLDQSYYFLTAKNFTITKEIAGDPSRLATSRNIEDGVEANEIVLELMKLKTNKEMFKQGTPSDFLLTIVAEVGIDAKKAENFAQSQKNIIEAVDNQRLSISGVDLDEEALNLIKFQNAYNLSARVITVMDQIYDKLINYMGV